MKKHLNQSIRRRMRNYQILPFRFARFNDEKYLLTNDVGEYIFLNNDDFIKFVNEDIDLKVICSMILHLNKLLQQIMLMML